MAADGEQDFRDCFRRLLPQARALARRITGDEALAEEIAAEALTRLYVRWFWLSRKPHLDAWVNRVATNLALDALRRRHRVHGPRAEAAPDPVHLVSDRLELTAALRKLPRRQREVVALRLLADLSEREVAAMLQLSEGTVKTHLHRALASLRTSLSTGTAETWEVPNAD
jgi:RNA polymerase sigma-70 factor (ECF subfamily)